ncbi:GNAT family acetyltransferase [Sphingomonas sp. RB3P16]|uniref:GNAT family acetyltransferase n=1 Tax=Parasphingomonas frigoris TaxID=3096163 RepID=UPI002FC78815
MTGGLGIAGPADAAAVIALWQACGLTRPWNDPAVDFALALGEGNATILLARDGGTVVGSVMVGFDGHRGWVYYLAVAPDARGRGLGRALMAAAEHWLRERGAPKVQLMVRGDNVAALGFYAALGLARQDVVVLGRFLPDESAVD